MPRQLTPEQAAARIRKWREAGFQVALVDGAMAALEADRDESRTRAPRRLGRLARTIRVIRPNSRRAARTGVIRLGLAAGSTSAANAVPYASVLQKGTVGFPPKERTKEHAITPQGSGWIVRWQRRRGLVGFEGSGKRVLSFVVNGQRVFRTVVRKHPGTRFPALDYLRVNEDRVRAILADAVVKSADKEI